MFPILTLRAPNISNFKLKKSNQIKSNEYFPSSCWSGRCWLFEIKYNLKLCNFEQENTKLS